MLSRLTSTKTHASPNPRIAKSGAFQLNFEWFPNTVDEKELRGVDAADSKSILSVGSAEYGTQPSDPRRNTRFADGIDHIPPLTYADECRCD